MSRSLLFVPLLLATSVVLAADGPEAKGDASAKKDERPKTLDGMSILGNQEAPKSLVIVPWKSSELGGSLDISTIFDDSRQPIDKEVFMRALSYYEIRSETTRPAQPATPAPRSKS